MPRARRNAALRAPSWLHQELKRRVRNRLQGGSAAARQQVIEELAPAVYLEWLVRVGLPQGLAVQDGNTFRLAAPPDNIRPTLDPIVREVVELSGDAEQLRMSAQFDDPEMAAIAAEGAVEAEQDALRGDEPEVSLQQRVAQMVAQGGDARTRGVLVGMHIGDPMVRGQPRAWLSRTVQGPDGPERIPGKAELHFRLYHGRDRTKKGPCPTCKAMARFFRVPGIGPHELAQIMEQFITETQAVTPKLLR